MKERFHCTNNYAFIELHIGSYAKVIRVQNFVGNLTKSHNIVDMILDNSLNILVGTNIQIHTYKETFTINHNIKIKSDKNRIIMWPYREHFQLHKQFWPLKSILGLYCYIGNCQSHQSSFQVLKSSWRCIGSQSEDSLSLENDHISPPNRVKHLNLEWLPHFEHIENIVITWNFWFQWSRVTQIRPTYLRQYQKFLDLQT